MAEVWIEADQDAVARRAADIVAQSLPHPSAVLGVATGSTPLGLYAELARRVGGGALDLSHVTAFALDEYLGLPADHPESYRNVVTREITGPLGIPRSQVPDGRIEAAATSGPSFERAIDDAGGVDLQILGIGVNGHLGFNEPGSSLASTTRVTMLAESTRIANSRFFPGEEVPLFCVTQGLGTILRARTLLLIATGESKATAVAAALEGPVGSMCPASIVQLHPAATVVLDEAAAAALSLAPYHRAVAAAAATAG